MDEFKVIKLNEKFDTMFNITNVTLHSEFEVRRFMVDSLPYFLYWRSTELEKLVKPAIQGFEINLEWLNILRTVTVSAQYKDIKPNTGGYFENFSKYVYDLKGPYIKPLDL